MAAEAPTPAVSKVRVAGLIAGPVVFAAVAFGPLPVSAPPAAQAVLGLTLWMALWWVTEAVPLAATSLLPLVVLPSTGIMGVTGAAAPYANPNVFLFMGGFLLAAAFQNSGLHRRIAVLVLARVGGSPRRLLLAFMVTTAVFSMWVSNTATAVMMLPIALAVTAEVATVSDGRSRWRFGLRTVLILGVAYGASIGGIATLVGTPPNLLFAGQVAVLLPDRAPIGFLQWMAVGLPLAAVYLVIAWAYLAFGILDPRDAKATTPTASPDLQSLGPVRRAEWIVASVFGLTVLAWLTRADLPLGAVTLRGWASLTGLDLHDGTVAMAAALLLFALPTDWRRGEFALDWPAASGIPWNVLILFGGGFSLAAGFDASGFASWLGGLATGLAGWPLPVLVIGLCALMVIGSEVASNTAQTALMLPILASVAVGLGLDPLWLMLPATLAASSGFMLPVATPPNAVAFASGHITAPQMARAGLALDVVGIALAALATFTLGRVVFGLP